MILNISYTRQHLFFFKSVSVHTMLKFCSVIPLA